MEGQTSHFSLRTVNFLSKWIPMELRHSAALIAGASGTTSADYEYGPLTERIRASGTAPERNHMRFSTKYEDETKQVYYGHRYLQSAVWISRDPIGEVGGVNRYAFVGNNSINVVDFLGQRQAPFGAGRLCVDKDCDKKYLPNLQYIPEDPPYVLSKLPKSGECVDADAIYFPGAAWKIADNASVTVKCDCTGAFHKLSYSRWPRWLGSGAEWKVGDPEPPNWPGHVPPYP